MKLRFFLFPALLVVSTLCARAEFAIRNGDTVVFLGDSITAAREYGEIIEDYTLLRFPQWKVRFINAGKGGETAKQSLARLDKDVFGRGATLLTVAYGINDIGWGAKADAAHKQDYLDAIGEIVDRCKRHGVRVFICSAAITSHNPENSEHSFLQSMCDEGLALAKNKGAGTIDVQRSMREIQRRALAANETKSDKEKALLMHAADTVHLNDLGQMAMAFAILKGLGAPAEVSAATLNARQGLVTASENCRISDLKHTEDGVTFTREDERWPFNYGQLWVVKELYIPIENELNRYLLTVTGLPAGRYEVTADDRGLGAWSAEALAHGINIASATTNVWVPGGPWEAQADSLKAVTESRSKLAATRCDMEQTLAPTRHTESMQKQTLSIEEELLALERAVAQPVPVKVVVRALAANPTAAPPAAKTDAASELPVDSKAVHAQ